MNKQKIAYFLLTVLTLCAGFVDAQDVAYSQFYANPLYLNPALAGSKVCPRFTLNYRNQWPSINKGYVNYNACYDQHFDKISGAIGLMVNASNAGGGILKSDAISLMYSYRLVISNSLVANVGFQGTYLQNKLDWNSLVFEDQLISGIGVINPVTLEAQPDHLTKGTSDFSAGMLIGYKESLYFGTAVHHLSQPDIAFYNNTPSKLDMKITVHAGAYIDLEQGLDGNDIENLSVSPNIMYIQQGNFRQLNLGMYMNVYPFVGGLWFRHNFENPDAIIALLGFQHAQFKVGYSYDYTVSKLTNATGGAHEVSFAWQFPCPQKVFKIKAIKCPRF
ncbi:MAG: type IX secretion system membrane protein PorP/SprF [Bacteroidales bacterium]